MKRTTLVALCVVVFATAAQADFIKNGRFDSYITTFETRNIPNWTVGITEPPEQFRDQSGVFFVVDGVVAPNSAMILLGTGGRQPGADVTTLTSDPFLVNQIRLEFQYVFATVQTLAESSLRPDDFSVTVTRTSDNAILYNATIASATDTDLVSSNISYGVLTRAAGRPNLRQTPDWEWVIIDSSSWVGDTVTVTFTVRDVFDDIWNSGVFLDNVRNIPEPGSIVLVGLFGAGIGFTAWKRRRAKK
jgi:hypothetical protein